MRIKTTFKDGTVFDTKPSGGFVNPEQTLFELYQNYKNNKVIEGTNGYGETIKKSYKEIKSMTIDF